MIYRTAQSIIFWQDYLCLLFKLLLQLEQTEEAEGPFVNRLVQPAEPASTFSCSATSGHVLISFSCSETSGHVLISFSCSNHVLSSFSCSSTSAQILTIVLKAVKTVTYWWHRMIITKHQNFLPKPELTEVIWNSIRDWQMGQADQISATYLEFCHPLGR